MEQSIPAAQEIKPEKLSAADVVCKIAEDYSSKKETRAQDVIDNVALLARINKDSGPNTSALLAIIGKDKEIQAAIIERLGKKYTPKDRDLAKDNIRIAKSLGMETDSAIEILIRTIETDIKKTGLKERVSKILGARARAALAMSILSISAGAPFISTTLGSSASTNSNTESNPTAPADGTQKYNITEEPARITTPTKEQRILYPKELSNDEVKPYIEKLRDSHDAVLTEALFTKELAGMSKEQRGEIMHTIAKAFAKSLVEHYGNSPTLIGIDPGHGGTDIGSSARTPDGKILLEKDLTWELSQMIADEIYSQSNGLYYSVILRPQNPNDIDLDKDGTISAVERLQKRKALLLETQKNIEENNSVKFGENVAFFSVHFNDDPDQTKKGTETYYPNNSAVRNPHHLSSSRDLARRIQEGSVSAIRKAGYPTVDLKAKEDPDKRPPKSNSDTTTGPYVALGSPKLSNNLASVKR